VTEVELFSFILTHFPDAAITEDRNGQVIIHTNKKINADGSISDLVDWSL
jgi:hypothetical protein